ncbi:MAG: DNA repair protein RecO [Acidiferrobacterales bacterium]
MRVSEQPAYVLHHYSYRETSLLLEIFARDYGRLGILAKGARRARPRTRMPLDPFQRLLMGWSGKGELPVLTGVDLDGDPIFLSGEALYCGFYMNELLFRLLHRHDPHEALFAAYQSSLQALQGDDIAEATLRIFEKRLLQEVGYGLVLDTEINNNVPIEPGRMYEYLPMHGPVRATDRKEITTEQSVSISGDSLIALARETLTEQRALRESKSLMRVVLGLYLGRKPLNSRKLFRDLKRIPIIETDTEALIDPARR